MRRHHAALALALGAVVCVLAGCGNPNGACSPGDRAAIEAAYTARMVAAGCTGPAVDTCEAGPALKAERLAEERSGGCLQ